ncbi:hypothetical protein O5476_07065 [Escherichia coli]|nr:hypothetical protein [Escherichia coli]
MAICKHLGGGQVYIPRGQVLDSLIRDLRIWNDFNGRNVSELTTVMVSLSTRFTRLFAGLRRIKYRQYQPSLLANSKAG